MNSFPRCGFTITPTSIVLSSILVISAAAQNNVLRGQDIYDALNAPRLGENIGSFEAVFSRTYDAPPIRDRFVHRAISIE